MRDGEQALEKLVRAERFIADEHDSTAWLTAADRPERRATPAGFVVVDRGQHSSRPHPMQARNGDQVAKRLEKRSLHDPQLDLSVETQNGQVAGYALFWFDPVTKVGLVEPVRTEDEYQRRELADCMLREGIDRLFERGADRVKISYQAKAAESAYLAVVFKPTNSHLVPPVAPQTRRALIASHAKRGHRRIRVRDPRRAPIIDISMEGARIGQAVGVAASPGPRPEVSALGVWSPTTASMPKPYRRVRAQ